MLSDPDRHVESGDRGETNPGTNRIGMARDCVLVYGVRIRRMEHGWTIYRPGYGSLH